MRGDAGPDRTFHGREPRNLISHLDRRAQSAPAPAPPGRVRITRPSPPPRPRHPAASAPTPAPESASACAPAPPGRSRWPVDHAWQSYLAGIGPHSDRNKRHLTLDGCPSSTASGPTRPAMDELAQSIRLRELPRPPTPAGGCAPRPHPLPRCRRRRRRMRAPGRCRSCPRSCGSDPHRRAGRRSMEMRRRIARDRVPCS